MTISAEVPGGLFPSANRGRQDVSKMPPQPEVDFKHFYYLMILSHHLSDGYIFVYLSYIQTAIVLKKHSNAAFGGIVPRTHGGKHLICLQRG